MATAVREETKQSIGAWRGVTPGAWQSRVNVRKFIQRNYTPYEGDGRFLQGPTERTRTLWTKKVEFTMVQPPSAWLTSSAFTGARSAA